MGMAQQKIIKLKINNSKLLSKLFFIFLLVIVFLNVGLTIYSLRTKYFSSDFWQRLPVLEKAYLDSQYVNKHPLGWIPDETVNSYAGAEYIKGTNPILIASDTPPLGRYLIGLSALIFNNENAIVLVCAILSLVLIYVLSYQVFGSKLLSIFPPLLFSFEPIFKNQLIYTPLLDIIQLVFLLSSFIFFNKALKSRYSILYFLLTNLFVGLFISTKFFITGVIVEAAFYFVLLFRKDKKRFLELTLTIPVAVITLLFSYIRVFSFGYTVSKFLGIQKWVFLYHRSQLILPFSIWPLILLNKWYVWYGNKPVISDSQWLITWPVVTLLTLTTAILGIIRKIKINENILVIIFWVILYFAFFSFGQISSRYFVILIPFLYIISLYGLTSLYKYIKK
jgi:hypothetical protein